MLYCLVLRRTPLKVSKRQRLKGLLRLFLLKPTLKGRHLRLIERMMMIWTRWWR
jgi:hypothetical protein